MMATMVDVICECGKKFQARKADRDRGWGRSCSKRCAKLYSKGKSRRRGISRRVTVDRSNICRVCGTIHMVIDGLCFHCEWINSPQEGWDDHKH